MWAKWFAAQSLKGVDKNYVQPNTVAKQKQFNKAVRWLRMQFELEG
jgi:hypothetical protein